MSGINQGLSLYSPEQDTKLYRHTDAEPINPDRIDFDKVNQELIESRKDTYDKTVDQVKGSVVGAFDEFAMVKQ